MNRTVHKFCAWSGLLFALSFGVGFVLLAGFVPPAPPSQNAAQIADYLLGRRNRVRWGMIVMMVGTTFVMPFTVSMVIHIRRIEGRFPALALIELGIGSAVMLEFIYPLFFWNAAVFRADRAPELVQVLNDMAWLPYIALPSTVIAWVAVLGVAVLMDGRENPIFPRWFGYYQLWVALMFTPGTFAIFFLEGPVAWNGLIALYLPISAFGTWMFITPIYCAKAVDSMSDDQYDLTLLRAQVDQLLAQRGS